MLFEISNVIIVTIGLMLIVMESPGSFFFLREASTRFGFIPTSRHLDTKKYFLIYYDILESLLLEYSFQERIVYYKLL